MEYQKTVSVIVLTLGLASAPFALYAAEEGSMSEHESHEKGEHVHEGMKKTAGTKGEARKEGASSRETSATSHDGHGKGDSGHDEMQEGSH